MRDAIHAAVADRFEIVRVPKWWARAGGGSGAGRIPSVPRVRRVLVYQACAAALEVPGNTNEWCKRVHGVVCSLGAVPAQPFNRRVYLGMRPRWKNPRPISKLNPTELARVQREWREALAADGFEDIERPQGALKRLPDLDATRADVNDGYLRRAREFYWRDLMIWHQHAVVGMSVREIEASLGVGRDRVQETIARLRSAMRIPAGHPEQGEETSADASEADGSDPGADGEP